MAVMRVRDGEAWSPGILEAGEMASPTSKSEDAHDDTDRKGCGDSRARAWAVNHMLRFASEIRPHF